MSTRKLRCAIYTGKSSEEGLDQAFNSLDAQREACAAYILSQAGEGWSAVKETYDDGGFSGGSMDRPALNRLMTEIIAGRVDVVVVYKVDRLTRSLADFARIVETLDKANASFVSVTQAFNTTNSMGRLTLNVLLSFAQFEREVTGERIRDKIAASKAKGMWMGGHPPLGYDIRERALHINPAEAETVREIFRRYLQVRGVIDLRDDLARDGVLSKRWVSRSGRVIGGSVFTHGALFHILANRLYVGDIVHRGKVHPGQHPAIVDPDLFEAVGLKLKAGAPPLPGARVRGFALPLLGRIFDDRGHPMTSAHAIKATRRYLYYASTAHLRRQTAGSLARVSAPRLHEAVAAALAPALRDDWRTGEAIQPRALAAVRRLTITREQLVIECDASALTPYYPSELSREAGTLKIVASISLAHPVHARRLIATQPASTQPRVDRTLLLALLNARRWTDELASGEIRSTEALAKRHGLHVDYLAKLLPLAYLAPDLVERVLDGRHASSLTLSALIARPLKLVWADQRAQLAAHF